MALTQDTVDWLQRVATTQPELWPICRDYLEDHGLHKAFAGLQFTPQPEVPMVWCPPGKFRMGYPKSKRKEIGYTTQVSVMITRGFWIGKYPVTERNWRYVMGEEHRKGIRSELQYRTPPGADVESYPVYGVSWDQAVQFADALTIKARAGGHLSEDLKYGLPTEAQWEYACRAGTKSEYFFGDDAGRLCDYAWFHSNSSGAAHAVGQRLPNGWGIYDMLVNVREWCRDNPRPKLRGGEDPFQDAKTSGPYFEVMLRVLRGGYWGSGANRCTPYDRGYGESSQVCISGGFRLVVIPTSTGE